MSHDAGSPPSERHPFVDALLRDDHDIAGLQVRDGVVVAANAPARRLFGHEKLVQTRATQLFPESCRDKARTALAIEEAGTWELLIVNANQEELAVRFLVVPTDRHDRLMLAATPAVYSTETAFKLLEFNDQLINTIRESSQRTSRLELARAELEQLGALRDQFITTLSHDLRSPLGAILLLAQMIDGRNEPPSAEELRRHAGRLARSVHRMLELVDGLLAQTRLQLGETAVHREPVALEDLAREAVDTLAPIAEHARVAIAVSSKPRTIVVPCDRLALSQVFSNLLSNALRHTRPGTTVRVDVWEVAGCVRCAVEDEGPGVPEEERERIFQRFHQVGARRGSSGLGLSIARQVIELHGGRIWVEPSAAGGARFVFELPRR
jgi:signal transduction histidine kinase